MNLTFEVKGITPTKIDFECNQKSEVNSFVQATRAECRILNDRSLLVLFGIRISTQELAENGRPNIHLVVEHVAEIQVLEDLPKVSNISEVPLIGNYIGIIYPFAREKVASILANAGINLILPPMNAIEHVKQNAGTSGFVVLDARNAHVAEEIKARAKNVQ